MAVQIPFPIPSHGYALNSKLRVNLDFLVNKFNEFNTGAATWDTVAIGIANNETGTLTFYNSSNVHYLTLQAGATSADITYTLPATNPTNPAYQFLMANSSGIMHWSSLNFPDTYTGNTLLYIGGTGTISELASSSHNILRGTNPPKYVSLNSTANQVTVTENTNDYTFSTPQDIGTSSNVQFGSLRVGAGSVSSVALRLNAVNTGFYTPSSTEIDFVIGGVGYALLDNTGFFQATGEIRGGTLRTLSSVKISTGASSIVTIRTDGTAFGDYTLILPPNDGSVNQYLTTDGSGTLTWTNAAGTGTVNSGTTNYLAYYTSSSNAVSATSALQLSGSSLLIPATTNQLILGTTRTATLTAPTPATSSRTYTFPDMSADYSVVATEGTQTINGAKTFTSNFSISKASPDNNITDTGTSYSSLAFRNNNGSGYIGFESAAGGSILAGSSGNAFILNQANAYALEFGTSNVLRFSISSTGVATFKNDIKANGGSANIYATTTGGTSTVTSVGTGGTAIAVQNSKTLTINIAGYAKTFQIYGDSGDGTLVATSYTNSSVTLLGPSGGAFVASASPSANQIGISKSLGDTILIKSGSSAATNNANIYILVFGAVTSVTDWA